MLQEVETGHGKLKHISLNVKCRLFKKFQSGRTRAQDKGLGLYLVKALVEDFRGRVWVEDRIPGDHTKGARFVVMLPVSA